MTTVHPDSATAPNTDPGPGEIVLLEQVRDAVATLLAELPGAPERLRIRAGDIELELDWAPPSPAPTAPAPGPPPSGPGANPAESSDAAGTGSSAGARVTAPTVGTFYRSPEPGAEPFVQVGDRVKPGQQVAILEVMKLMIPVEADLDGVITEVLAEDGQPVEYGQALFGIDPGA
ncbi:biotin/lipoyl-containing protein [Actinomadura sp. KC06]|uniref:acetyl-CoA carboxylase biotin carboxyl carrier protein n=1 Tax=Actinomadura sp. KC06 TaxID=2530369 RepID=UPI0014053548|nr:biotin/lipoyl-containing protein [Actinomadura sp. KC06]